MYCPASALHSKSAERARADNPVHNKSARHIFQLLRHTFGNGPQLRAACAGLTQCQNLINPGHFGRQRFALGFGLLPPQYHRREHLRWQPALPRSLPPQDGAESNPGFPVLIRTGAGYAL